MKDFKKYQHIERFETSEVHGINIGVCHVFPKIDGTNASVWFNGKNLCFGSRNRELSLENDNAGFMSMTHESEPLKSFFTEFPDVTLYGEWLVPHSLKTYREDAWNHFYVFDVCFEENMKMRYMEYCEYSKILEKYNIEYIPCLASIENARADQFFGLLESNQYLIKDGCGAGEGIIIKNYGFKNAHGKTIWAKIVRSEFRDENRKAFGHPEIRGRSLIEIEIADKFFTKTFCEKEFAKISINGWSSKMIPRLLGILWYEFIKEELWNSLKQFKNPTIDFKLLNKIIIQKTKEYLPGIF